MAIIDDLQFAAKVLLAKIQRINEIAGRVEVNPTGKKDLALLKVMTTNMEDMQNQYHELIQKIAAYNAKQNPRIEEDLDSSIVKFDEAYYNIKAIVDTSMSKEEKSNHTFLSANIPTHQAFPAANISLPPLKLIEFDGDLKSWSNFSELYLATVHNNSQLSDIQRYMYLRSVLKNEALALIASLPITAANYQVAWNALQSRYNDSNLLTNSYLELLFTPGLITREAKSLRAFATSLTEYTGALERLGHEISGWAVPVLFIIVKRLSPPLRERWEKFVVENPAPSINQFITFVSDEARVLEAAYSSSAPKRTPLSRPFATSTPTKSSAKGPTTLVMSTSSSIRCALCDDTHSITQCSQFRNKSVTERHRFAKRKQLCLNCLNSGHFVNQCPKRGVCKHCSSRHHTLLHFGNESHVADGKPVSSVPCNKANSAQRTDHSTETSVGTLQTNTTGSTSVILLATAEAFIRDGNGKYQKVKVLIDSASQGTFITRACAERLELSVQPKTVPVFGMAQTKLGIADGAVTCIFERAQAVQLIVHALVVDRITNSPSMPVPLVEWTHLRALKLADKNYHYPHSVDILLGAEWFGSVILGNPIVGPPGTPSALETIWGYCLVGRVQCTSPMVETFCVGMDERLDSAIRKFWEVEEAPASRLESDEERACEAQYQQSVARTSSGRYITELPFKMATPLLGESRETALRRFQSIERRLAKNADLRIRYNEFMSDYIDQGHMVRALHPIMASECGYYIPHHCISSSESQCNKFRVVFDASMKTTSGMSLNDTLHTGPKLQANLLTLLVTFRLHHVVVVADIRQMYRNILISNKHHNFQRIFWRFNPEEPLQEYCLTTVTYGVSASPFLAIRTLHQLVADEGGSRPAASRAILSDTYMDDIVTSVPSVNEARTLQRELIDLMNRGGFELRKWRSNRPELLSELKPEQCAMSSEAFSFEERSSSTAKILGLVWDPVSDCLSFRISLTDQSVTKRTILSDIARLFDPLGLVCPVIFYGKWLIQYLWQLGLSWDEEVPEEIRVKWLQIRRELPELAAIALRRCVSVDNAVHIHLHGFADSSEKGYAGVVYLCTEQRNGNATMSLILAKSKIAPLKKVTIPRLELCAVVLTARLVHHVKTSLQGHCLVESLTVWTDSKVALSWVQSSPHRWHTYIANRISQAQSYVSPQQYRHVSSERNPADCASRGLTPRELLQHPLWLSGPDWLTTCPHLVPSTDGEEVQEIRQAMEVEARIVSLQTSIGPTEVFVERLFSKASSLSFLKRVTAWIVRFAYNSRHQNKRTGTLSAAELSAALSICIKCVQAQEFADDIKLLNAGQQSTSRLRKLNPFLDNDGLLRVGGRLTHSQLSEDKKHPILLPKSHPLTVLVIDHYHKLYLHPSTQNLQSIIQAQFWILSARDVIRRRLAKCITCFKTQPRPVQPMMSDLPAARLRAAKAFKVTGVDYGGPFEITLGKIRKAKIYKAYICLFVCFTTKAIHLELVSELTTDAFLAALRRFIARRGHVSDLYSDCGTNFVGARRKLSDWAQFVTRNQHNELIRCQLAERNINWHFNPPSGPHFGGIWEAGIKSTKQLLRKVVGSQILTYEEFYTVLVQVEATLNSRPLTPCSSDPNDLETLTPGHFLLLEPPAALMEPDAATDPVSSNQRWKLLQQINASFWKRWSADYLCTLQQRVKWTRSGPNIEPDSLVLIREDNLPPLQWRRGRVVRVFPGSDGIVRVAEIRTATGVITRPVVKLCPLPIN